MNNTFFKYKRLHFVILTLLICLIFPACRSDKDKTPLQMEKGGEYVARIHFKDIGYVDLNLYTSSSETAVNEFIRLAKEGHYNGNSIKTVIDDYAFLVSSEQDITEKGSETSPDQTSTTGTYDPGDAASGKTGGTFSKEINKDFYPFRGALCLTDNGKGISADQFMVITSDQQFLKKLEDLLAYKKVTPAEYYKAAYGTELDEETLALFDTYGGAPWLYGHCIVFGQIYAGQDVLDAISKVDIEEGSSYTPSEDIVIEYIEVK